MKKIGHLLKMTVKVGRERGFRSLFFRIYIYLRDLTAAVFYFLYFEFSKKGKQFDILYVSGCPGGSRLYRCENQSQELEKYKIKSIVVSQNSSMLGIIVKYFRVIVFQRVIYDKHIEGVVKEIKKRGIPLFFETDDLVFMPNSVEKMGLAPYMSEEELGWYKNGIGREIFEDDYVEHCVVSTHYLKDKINSKSPRKKVFVLQNRLGREQIRWAEKFYKNRKKYMVGDGKVRVGYFSGGKSHDRDFETVSDVLIELLEKNEDLVLMIAGHLRVRDEFSRFENRIERFDFVSPKKLPGLLLRADINIAPLEIDNIFCQAKSALKFFEAGILEVPTVASATDSFCRAIENEKDGFLAASGEDWKKYLSSLIADPGLRKKIGREARKSALEKYTVTKDHAESREFAEYIKNLKNLSCEINNKPGRS